MDSNHVLELKKFGLKFGETVLLDNFNLTLRRGEFISFVGLNGSGKTATLKAICGIGPHTGEVIMKSRIPPSLVFQSAQLFPWLTIFENLNLCAPRKEFEIQSWLRRLDLTRYQNHKPNQLSGGTLQKVALVRALLFNSEFILLDEPFSNLDVPQRHEFQKLVYEIWQDEQSSIIFVSHDVEEAALLSQKIYFFSKVNQAVAQVIEVPFSYPRSPLSLAKNLDFVALQENIKLLLIEDYGRFLKC